MESEANDFVYERIWSLILVPEDLCLDGLAGVMDLFDDLIDIGLEDHAQFPTAVFFKETTD